MARQANREDTEFKQFVKDILTGPGGVRDDVAEKLLTKKKNIDRFRLSFVSKTHDRYENYEQSEFIGDGFLHAYAVKFIRTKFPSVKNPDWMTRIQQYLNRGKTLGLIAYKNNFMRFMKVGDKIVQDIEDKDFRATLEDTFEAFIGAVVTAFDDEYPDGVGYAVGKNIAFHYYFKLDIPLKRELLWDPITRLKELYEKYKWPSKPQLVYKIFSDRVNNVYTVTVYGWPHLRNSTVPLTLANRQQITTFTDKTDALAKNGAANAALTTLIKAGFVEKLTDPGQKD